VPALVPYDESDSGSESGLGESDTDAEAAAYAWEGAGPFGSVCRNTRLTLEEARLQLRALVEQYPDHPEEEDELVPHCRLYIHGKRGRRYAASADVPSLSESTLVLRHVVAPTGECGFKRGFLM